MKKSVSKIFAFVLAAVLLITGLTAISASATKVFPDVKQDKWYYSVVTDMTSQGLLNGYEDGNFKPNKTISFSEFVAIVARCVSLEDSIGQTSHWASDKMQAALEKGWYDWDECPPTGETFNSPIQRQIATKVLIKAFAPDATGDYSTWYHQINDAGSISGRYYDTTWAAYELGLIEGDNNGNFNPAKGLTRAESCAIISRALLKFPQGDIKPSEPTPEPITPVSGGVTENGWLKLDGTKLCNEKGNPVILHGMSSHGIQWFPEFTSKAAIKTTSDYGANLFRVAMYTEGNGYITNKDKVKKQVIAAVDNAISLDMYVIIDWHILSDNNPNTYVAEAKIFFKEISEKYKDKPNVIYEICNEPNGGTTWDDIYKYANEVIPVIRKNSPKSIIICGTPTWSQDVDIVSKKKLPYSNVMYSFHFYAGTHKQSYRNKVKTALKAGTPVFVSEWGTCDASGNGGIDLSETKVWLDFLDENGISWANWSLCNKDESASALKPSASSKGGWRDSDFTQAGKYVFSRF